MRQARKLACFVFAGLLGASAVLAQSDALPGQQPPPPGERQAPPAPRGTMMRTPGPAMERTRGPMGPGPDLGKWWKDSQIAGALGLNDQQINQIEATFLDHRLKLIDMNADVQRSEARLQPLMESDQVDEAKVSAQIDQLLAARSRLEKANMMMMISIRKVLTIEQWKKLEGIRESRERMFMRTPRADGPEGPGGAGGFGGGAMRKRPGPPEEPPVEN